MNSNLKHDSLQKSKQLVIFGFIFFFFAIAIMWTWRNCVRLIRFQAEQWTEKKDAQPRQQA